MRRRDPCRQPRSSFLRGALLGFIVAAFAVPGAAYAQIGSSQRIDDSSGGFEGRLDDGDHFGNAAAHLGDYNDDGRPEIAVGTPLDDDGGEARGAVWLLSLNEDGTVASSQKISDTEGGFEGTLQNRDEFGASVAHLGDYNGDDQSEIAVGARLDDDGGSSRGAVWILSLTDDGTVASSQKISDTTGGFGGSLDDEDHFGDALAEVGDVDGDGVSDLAVGLPFVDDGGTDRGAVWILFLNTDGTVDGQQKISDTTGGLDSSLEDGSWLGLSVSGMGKFDGDAVPDLAVGFASMDGGFRRGGVWILSLESDGTVGAEQKISDTEGGFEGELDDTDLFGGAVSQIDDLDGNGVQDLLVGAPLDGDGGGNRGALWVLYLNSDGTVAREQKISDTSGGFSGGLGDGDRFGSSAADLGDLNGDGVPELAAGAPWDGDVERGALWILFGEQSLLPVELVSFDGTTTEGSVRLTWKTASETNNAGFEVQRRAGESARWRQVGYVESKAEGGTTTEPTSYEYTTEKLAVGTHRFRLRQVDLDGSRALADPVTVRLRMEQALRLSAPAPNPVRSTATVRIAVKERTETQVTLYNVLGQKVRTLYQGTPPVGESQALRLEASSLPSGTYLLRLKAGGQTKTRRMTVVR